MNNIYQQGYQEPNELAKLRANIFGLAVSCPYSNDNPYECPLHEIRKLTLKQRKEWVDGLTGFICHVIYENHLTCRRKKESQTH